MKRTRTLRRIVGVCVASAALSAGVAYALDIFVEIPGIPGDSQSSDFSGQIVASSVELASRAGRRGVAIDQLTFEQFTDSASPLLWETMWNGTTLPTLTLRVVAPTKGARTPVQVFALTNVRVRSMSQSGDGEESAAVRVSVSFDEIDFTSTDVNRFGTPGRSSTTGYDLRTGTPR